jgi:peroxiredoxin
LYGRSNIEIMSELKDFQKLVIANAGHVKGLKVGDKAPDFILPDPLGKEVSLSHCLKSGPVILKFYRGEWCPICNIDLREIQKYVSQFESYSTRVLAISPQRPDDAITITKKTNLVLRC